MSLGRLQRLSLVASPVSHWLGRPTACACVISRLAACWDKPSMTVLHSTFSADRVNTSADHSNQRHPDAAKARRRSRRFNMVDRMFHRLLAHARLSGAQTFLVHRAIELSLVLPEISRRKHEPEIGPFPFRLNKSRLAVISGMSRSNVRKAHDDLVAMQIFVEASHDPGFYLINLDGETWIDSEGEPLLTPMQLADVVAGENLTRNSVSDWGEIAYQQWPRVDKNDGLDSDPPPAENEADPMPEIRPAPYRGTRASETIREQERQEKTPLPPEDGGDGGDGEPLASKPPEDIGATIATMAYAATRDEMYAENVSRAARMALGAGYAALEVVSCWTDALESLKAGKTSRANLAAFVASKLGCRKVRGEQTEAKIIAEHAPAPLKPIYVAPEASRQALARMKAWRPAATDPQPPKTGA